MIPVFDAVVIGAGPAGSCTALLLARLGWRTALVERGPRHRAKACGNCLSPRGERVLQQVGLLSDVRDLAVGRTRRLRVHLEGRMPLQARLPSCAQTGHGLLVERPRFDQLLIDRAAEAGVQVLQPATARVGDPDGRLATVDVSTGRRLRCRLLIGADGLRSSVARRHGLSPHGRAGGKLGFSIDVRCARANVIRPDAIEMFLVAGGYVGVVNQGAETLHVAGLMSPCDAPSRNPLSFTESVAARFDILRTAGLDRLEKDRCGRLLGAGPMPWRPRRVAGARVALVGDAAGYVEPFTGEGMSWALAGAHALAAAVADVAPGVWTPATARRYGRSWNRLVGGRLRRCAVLARILQRPRLSRAVLGVSSAHPRLVARLVRQAVAG